jgi:hypothetical protein
MDLKSGKITLGELIRNPRARAVLAREFPQYDNPIALALAKGFTLNKLLELAEGSVSRERVEEITRELEEL